MNELPKPHSLTPALASLSTLVNGTILESDEAGAREALLEIAAVAIGDARPPGGEDLSPEAAWHLAVADAFEALAHAYASAYPPGEDSLALLRGRTQDLSAALFSGFILYARKRDAELGGSHRTGGSPPGTSLADLGLE